MWEKKYHITCRVCGQEFMAKMAKATTCSGICHSKRWRQEHIKSKPIGQCVICSASFEMHVPHHKTCSKECHRIHEASTKKKNNSGVGMGGATRGMEFAERRFCENCGNRFKPAALSIRKGQGKYCSQKCYGEIVATHPELFPCSHKRGAIGKRPDLDNRFFRSRWEANYARYLNWLVAHGEIASWEYEVDTYEFTTIKRGSRFYTPDFKVFAKDGSFEYHEVKGYMDTVSATKMKRMAKFYPKIKVLVIAKPEYLAVARVMKSILPGWEFTPKTRF